MTKIFVDIETFSALCSSPVTCDEAVGCFSRVCGQADFGVVSPLMAEMDEPSDISERRRFLLQKAKSRKTSDPNTGATKRASATAPDELSLARPAWTAHARAPPSMASVS